jgi:hypothetical protein
MGATCPRCHGPLPEGVVRELPRGTACPFCSAPLKRTEGQTAIEVSAPNAGRASPQVAGPPKPAAVPAPPALTAAAAPKDLRATMVGVAVAPRALPFDSAPAPLAIAPSPPAAPTPVRAPAVSVRAGAAAAPAPNVHGGASAAVARTIAAPTPARTPSVRPTVAPAAGKPMRSLTPAQTQDQPPSTPAPALKTPPHAVVMPRVAEADSEPTHVIPPTPSPKAAEASEPVLVFPESDGVIDSVTMTADAEPPAPPPAPTRSPLAPIGSRRRGLALLGIGMGVAIVAVAAIGVKLLRRPQAPPSPPVAAEIAKPAPEIEPVAPALEAPAAPSAAPARAATGKAASKAAARGATPKAEARHEAPVAAKHEAPFHKRHDGHKANAHQGGAHHARKVAKHEAAAKPSAPAPATDKGDPRPLYEKGNALLFSGDAKGATVAYREAVHLAPNDPIGFRGLGLAYETQGETASALRAFKRYLKLAPDAPDRAIIQRRIDRLRAKK